jgi:hypothetical protein
MTHEHKIGDSPYERARDVLARHLCGWITGHGAPEDHFKADADLILADIREAGVRFHLAGATENTYAEFTSTRWGGR